jgi:hypothetical protein
MTLTIYLILSLTGASLLGFATAWFWQSHNLQNRSDEVKKLAEGIKEEKAVSARLQVENETQKLSIENMQKLMQNLENQCFTLEQEVKRAEFSSEILRDEKHRLMAELDSQMRENEVMREMPEIDVDIEVEEYDESEMDLRAKAKKLVRAFKKGYQQIDNPPPTSS